MNSRSNANEVMRMSPAIVPMTQTLPTSCIRRKPRITYKSPSGGESYTPGSLSVVTKNAPSSSHPPVALKTPNTSSQTNTLNPLAKRKKYPMGPPLPLYHPLGRLALSLPPLDPASVGLPVSVKSDDAVRRSSARARRPVAKLRDVEEDLPQTVAEGVEPVVEVEVKEKASPRKRRGGGGGLKRKRKEVDNGDATYPAKRTRIPRGTAHQSQAVDDDPPVESVHPVVEATPTPEPTLEASEDGKSERRTTRSRGAVKRRGSSASEAPSSVSVGAVIGSVKDRFSMDSDRLSDGGLSQPLVPEGRLVEEKEEGELSESPPSQSQRQMSLG